MLSKNKIVILLALSLFLNLICACSSMSLGPNSHYKSDPVAEAGMKVRNESPLSSSENQPSSNPTYSNPAFNEADLNRALKVGELAIGMEMNDVLSVWGQPREINTAGDPQFLNQKWIYMDSLSANWKIGSTRIVYFESGKVAGWETNPNSSQTPPHESKL